MPIPGGLSSSPRDQFYALRRSEALALRWEDVDLNAGTLRVSGLEMTMNTYGHVSLDDKRAALDKINDALSDALD